MTCITVSSPPTERSSRRRSTYFYHFLNALFPHIPRRTVAENAVKNASALCRLQLIGKGRKHFLPHLLEWNANKERKESWFGFAPNSKFKGQQTIKIRGLEVF